MPETRAGRWLLLIHRIPSKPDYLRVRIGRSLRRLGAAAVKNSVYVLPATPRARTRAAAIAREILRLGGEALVCESRFVAGLTDEAVEDLLRAARDAEYAQVARRAEALIRGLGGLRGRSGRTGGRGGAAHEAARRRAGQALERLRLQFDRTVALDACGAAGREAAAGLLSLLEDRLQGVDDPAGAADTTNAGAGTPAPPHGATWATRAGVMVDRIASAWLIRRFIDPAARFRFHGRGERPRPGEIRFDMAGAAHTHRDGLCTFEVLVLDYQLRDPALRPIAEIVHDLDLEDGRHGRPEAAGVDRMIVGLALATASDEARLERGGAIFEGLYEAFRRRRA